MEMGRKSREKTWKSGKNFVSLHSEKSINKHTNLIYEN